MAFLYWILLGQQNNASVVLSIKNRAEWWETKKKLTHTPRPHTHSRLFPGSILLLRPYSSILPPAWAVQGDGKWCCGQFITPCLWCCFLLVLSSCSCTESFPQDAALHELLQLGSFLQTAVLQEMLQHGSFLWSRVLQESTALAWVPPESKFLPESLLVCELLSTYHSMNICSTVVLHGLEGNNMCHHVSHHRLQGICTAAPGAPPPSPSLLTFMSEELFLSHFSHSSLSKLVHSFFYPFINILSQGHQNITDGLRFGQQRVPFGVSWKWLCPTWAQPVMSSNRNQPCSSPATKILSCKPKPLILNWS